MYVSEEKIFIHALAEVDQASHILAMIQIQNCFQNIPHALTTSVNGFASESLKRSDRKNVTEKMSWIGGLDKRGICERQHIEGQVVIRISTEEVETTCGITGVETETQITTETPEEWSQPMKENHEIDDDTKTGALVPCLLVWEAGGILESLLGNND